MQMKKIISCTAAAALAVSAFGAAVSAEAPYTATIGFSDMSWSHQDWETSVEVTGDGTYTLTSTALAGAEDFGVFVIDIVGMYAGDPDATAVLDKIEVDGSEISFDASKIIYGDIEEKGNFRIEIFNQYGDTIKDSPVNDATSADESIAITFTVSGLGGGAAEEETPEEEEAPAEEASAEEVVEETPDVEEIKDGVIEEVQGDIMLINADEPVAIAEVPEEVAPVADSNTVPAATGNAAAASAAVVMIAAGAAAVISKRK